MKTTKRILLAAVVTMGLPFAALAGGSNHLTKATVTAIDGTTITATYAEGTYTIDASLAKITRRFGGKSTVAEISVGDKLNVKGAITFNNVAAKTIENWSIQRKGTAFNGKITSIDAENNSFVLKTSSNNSQTFLLSPSTKIKSKKAVKTILDLKVGDKIQTKGGLWDRTLRKITSPSVVEIKKSGK